MDLLFVHPSFWWALAAGALLMTGELAIPATVLLWTGVSCVLVAPVLALDPTLPLIGALGLWMALSLATILTARWLHHRRSGADRVAAAVPPNRYGMEFVGMTAVLPTDSADGQVRLTLKGANWGVKLPQGDLKSGSRVRITAVEGIFLVAHPD